MEVRAFSVVDVARYARVLALWTDLAVELGRLDAP
jgi:hypothetical protein